MFSRVYKSLLAFNLIKNTNDFFAKLLSKRWLLTKSLFFPKSQRKHTKPKRPTDIHRIISQAVIVQFFKINYFDE